jgi:hypothetical protein
MPLDQNQKHLIILVAQEAKSDGWAIVSEAVWPLLLPLPQGLIELRQLPNGGLAKLTEQGQAVVTYLG